MSENLIPFNPLRGMADREQQLAARRKEIESWRRDGKHSVEIFIDGQDFTGQVDVVMLWLDCGLTLTFGDSDLEGKNDATE